MKGPEDGGLQSSSLAATGGDRGFLDPSGIFLCDAASSRVSVPMTLPEIKPQPELAMTLRFQNKCTNALIDPLALQRDGCDHASTGDPKT